jgi:hypothetical protein
MPGSKYHVFTLNNPELEAQAFLNLLDNLPCLKYAVFQEEEGDNGTRHFQGYLELNARKSFAWIKRRLSPRLHLEQRRGTAQQAKDYATKEETRVSGPFECGTWSPTTQGQRTDLESAIDTLRTSKSLKRVAEEHPVEFVKFGRGLQHLRLYTMPRRESPPTIHLYFGGTGIGKSFAARSRHGPCFYSKPPDTKWFDGYDGEECLLLDDFAGAASKLSLQYLLVLLDEYDAKLEVKGGYVPLLSTSIVITTNIHPRTWYDYSNREEQYRALARRIANVWTVVNREVCKCDHEHFFSVPDGPIPGDE